MRAYVRLDAKSQEVILAEVPIPEITPEEVLIKVKAFGVGIHDRYFIPSAVPFPYVIGSEGTGTITKLGSLVTNFKIGDSVIFTTTLQPQGGCWAESAAANEGTLISLPNNLTFEQGAAIPIAGKTALECMRALNLNKGDTLFIAGASGAIGTFVIQLAVANGIQVSGSASPKNHAYLKTLGIDKAVDYHAVDWPEQIKRWSGVGVTAALAIQPTTGIDSIKVIKDGGKLITVSGDNDQVSAERGISVEQMGHHQDTHQRVIQLVKDISNGKIQVVLENEYDFEHALEALRKTETRHARGKLVVKDIR